MEGCEDAGGELGAGVEAVRGLQEEACTLLIIVTLLLHIAIAMLWRSVCRVKPRCACEAVRSARRGGSRSAS